MKLLVLIALLCTLVNAHDVDPDNNDCSTVDTEDIPQYFCNADLVFVGKHTGGMSSKGPDYVSMATSFEVEDLFKGDDSIDEINIYRKCYSQCDENPFAGTNSLVFASYIDGVTEYMFSAPWDCVSEDLKNQIKESSFDCRH